MRRVAMVVMAALFMASCGGGEPSGGEPIPTGATTIAVGPGTTGVPRVDAPTGTARDAELLGLDLDVVARRLSVPVYAIAPPGDERIFVLEKAGTIRIIDDGEVEEEPFLDLTAEVESNGLEQGLLGLAFHPDYEDNGRFFVYFTAKSDGGSRLWEYRVSADEDRADGGTARLLLSHPQPDTKHNAGMLQFGPDGYLYVSFGDGGGAGDQFGNGQRTDTLLATIIRIDVDASEPYAVPPDNPFVAGGGRAEVWAYGVRNPWRFAIDAPGGLMYIADVGQDESEEISAVPLGPSGGNLGWPITEGFECFKSPSCDTAGLVAPVLAYGHDEGCSVTGGFVYRGGAIPEIAGHYFYGDWCARWVRSFFYDGSTVTDERDWTAEFGDLGQIVSFGLDGDGELLIVTQEGPIYRVVPVR